MSACSTVTPPKMVFGAYYKINNLRGCYELRVLFGLGRLGSWFFEDVGSGVCIARSIIKKIRV